VVKKARAINIASMRAMDKLRSSGHPILVFPSGTRYRPGKPETKMGRRVNFQKNACVEIRNKIDRMAVSY